jgi:hypothetical protein
MTKKESKRREVEAVKACKMCLLARELVARGWSKEAVMAWVIDELSEGPRDDRRIS